MGHPKPRSASILSPAMCGWLFRRSLISLGILVGLVLTNVRGAEPDPYQPTNRYETRQVEGWTVLVHKRLLDDHPRLAGDTLTLLRQQLFQVVRQVPDQATAKLRAIRIWVEENEEHHPCMVYHPDAEWLRAHGMNPEKAKCVEISNARRFLNWTKEQPWMVLHELAHGYHHQFLKGGFENDEVRALFQRAVDGKSYESVLRIDGSSHSAYALTNPMEYFAEGSEALFGTNDFYPFVRAELKRHDPELHGVLRRLWGLDAGRRLSPSRE